MKKLCVVMGMIFALLSCVGCGQRLDPAVLPEEKSAEEITVAVCQSEAFEIESFAALFENETGIKVNIINYFDPASTWDHPVGAREYAYDEEGNTIYVGTGGIIGDGGTENYITTANTDLMAGKGADIYDVGLLDYTGLGQNGLLCNMSGWIDEDPELSDEILIHSILKAAEEDDGSLYAIMPGFHFDAAAQNGSDLESPMKNEPETWEEFFENAANKPRQGVIYKITDQAIFMKRFQDHRDEFMGGENDARLLDSPEMVELLEQCRAWAEEGYIIDSRDPDRYEKLGFLYYREAIRGATAQALLGVPASYSMEPSDDSAHQWENRLVTDQGLYGINAASESRGAAWAFLKMMLSEKVQRELIGSLSPDNFPVYRDELEERLRNELVLIAKSEGKTDQEIAEQVDEVMEKFDGMDQIKRMQPYDKIIRAAASQYFTGQLTAQQAAKQMGNNVGLYLKEAGKQ